MVGPRCQKTRAQAQAQAGRQAGWPGTGKPDGVWGGGKGKAEANPFAFASGGAFCLSTSSRSQAVLELELEQILCTTTFLSSR